MQRRRVCEQCFFREDELATDVMERDGLRKDVQAEMFYPELWKGKSNRLGIAAETVYREAKGGPTVCGGPAWIAIRDLHSKEEPCHPGTDWEYIILPKRKASCMIKKTSLKLLFISSKVGHMVDKNGHL